MKNEPWQPTKHHRLPRSRGGTNDPKNISIVRRDKHELYHKFFGNMNTHEIAVMLNEIWIDVNFILKVERRKKC